jgi:hypothetical protein
LRYFKTYLKVEMTYSQNDGIAHLLKKQDISLCVKENGTESIVTSENTNVQIAQTGSLHICHTMISSTILLEKINLDVTLSVFIQYAKIIPVTFYVLILMTRIVNMAIPLSLKEDIHPYLHGTTIFPSLLIIPNFPFNLILENPFLNLDTKSYLKSIRTFPFLSINPHIAHCILGD